MTLYIVGGKHKRRKLMAPKSSLVRPTASQVREALFNICQNWIQGAHFLDLFAGSGAMGLEALSRGAAHATFVEKGRPALNAIKQNIATLNEEDHTTVLQGDVLTVLPFLKGPFELIFVDPPYGKNLGAAALDLIDSHRLLAEDGTLFIEDTSMEEPKLKTLELKQKRTFGRTTLFEYGYRTTSRNV